MATTQTFGGGVHPREVGNGKQATQSKQIVNAAAPARVTIALAQSAGAGAVCCVKPGQIVNMGQVIGQAEGVVSAAVHASVSGKVVAVTTCTVPSGKTVPAVVIDNDFEDRWDPSVQPLTSEDGLTSAQIVQRAADCGLVGLGGAAFPTAVKLDTANAGSSRQPDTLIINGSECEPYLTSDHRLMVEEAEKVMDGITLAIKATGVQRAIVGIEDNKPDAIEAMRAAAKEGIEVVSLPTHYPQGFEKMLIYSLTGRRVPDRALPAAVQCAVLNVATCAALSDAVRTGRPLIDRVVTVTGRVKEPKNLRVRIGTPLLDVLDQVGGLTDGVRKLVVGGPMMGNAIASLDMPITKNFGGFVAMGDEAVGHTESACIRCGRCMRACPMGLAPAKIDNMVRRGNYAAAASAINCMECGSCTYVCPAKRELTQSCRVAKAMAKRTQKH